MDDASSSGPDRRTVMVAAAALASTTGAAVARIPDIVRMDAHSLSAAIATRKLSCVEVMTAYLDHIAAFNPKVNAIVALQDRTGLLAQARERDAQVARGQILGPLHGFPHAVKDLQPVAGIRSTSGSPILKDFVPTHDSLFVERLRAGGVIFIGKTNVPEFGLGSHTYNPVYGATHNAYDQSKSAGGSSGGAAHAARRRRYRLWRQPAQSGGLEQCLRLSHQLRRGSGGRQRCVAAQHERRRADGAQHPRSGPAAVGAGRLRSARAAVGGRYRFPLPGAAGGGLQSQAHRLAGRPGRIRAL